LHSFPTRRSSDLEPSTPLNGQAPGINGFLIRGHFMVVLIISPSHLANGRNSHGDQVTVAMSGVTLEVSVQLARALGDRQLVVRFGKMIHADVFIACA